jgi:hypothetical protein
MKIDRIDIVRKGTELETYIMNTYNENARYVFLDKNGKEHTVQFSPKRLDEFLPSRTVSETITMWEEGIKNKIKHYESCIKTGEHPYWTTIQYYYVIVEGYTFPVEKTMERPSLMTKDQIKHFKSEIEKLKEIDGKMSFVKIVSFDFIENKLCNIFSETSMSKNLNKVKINKITDKKLYVEAVYTGHGHEERTNRNYTINKSDIASIVYL